MNEQHLRFRFSVLSVSSDSGKVFDGLSEGPLTEYIGDLHSMVSFESIDRTELRRTGFLREERRSAKLGGREEHKLTVLGKQVGGEGWPVGGFARCREWRSRTESNESAIGLILESTTYLEGVEENIESGRDVDGSAGTSATA